MQIRDRIKELRRVRAGELLPNPKNWRTHPASQQNALRGLLAEVGYADALLVREVADGRLELIDGHLRAETTPEALVPVLVLDVNEEEADKVLLTHDPLASLAIADEQKVVDLKQMCDFKNPQVAEMIEEYETNLIGSEQLESDKRDQPEIVIPEMFQVVIECNGEQQQEEVYERMTKEGYRCRVLTL